ncbi:hypothetical protein [Levilactobacillus acidifarinae]|uniref:Uncharacterized protein n=1 Tax=Levilactobacillus acidifarinae DSM 19394 = JCM 15949 TaxID=1423715 RepID=A0A0R1LID4_9LACO|nr:hypothetical protein [Levilactobacillus acidifarinae]KRK95692.1 hypothetical protein FD25_GL000107 [Levilactobacillus acidifarinae DSM 19394]GEO69428.1 hypothetical protein LAC03_13380 [Levilactobacillus acidifarinae]
MMLNPQAHHECFALPQKNGALLLIPETQRVLYTDLLAYQEIADDLNDTFDDPGIDEAARSQWLTYLDDQATQAGQSLDVATLEDYLFLLD